MDTVDSMDKQRQLLHSVIEAMEGADLMDD